MYDEKNKIQLFWMQGTFIFDIGKYLYGQLAALR